MRTIIAGSRDFHSLPVLIEAIDSCGFEVSEVVSGRARGADRIGEEWALRNDIPIIYHPANWDKFGRSAGYIRNSEMAEDAEALIAIWDGRSHGTKNMIEVARKKGLEVFVYEFSEEVLNGVR